MIDLNQSTENQKKKIKSKRILIAEPDSNIQYFSLFYKTVWLFNIRYEGCTNGYKCLEIVFSDTNHNDNDYDIIMLDTHLHDIAWTLRDRLPHKKIILTTTYSLDNISNIIDSIGIKSKM